MRLIDADALECDTEWSEYHDGFISYSQLEIDTAPSIDIVRCKECKHYAEHNELYINEPTTCVKHSVIGHYVVVNPDDFCSYGERKSDD